MEEVVVEVMVAEAKEEEEEVTVEVKICFEIKKKFQTKSLKF